MTTVKVPIIVENSPNTALILGAALSGGDVKELARQLAGKPAKRAR